MAIQSKQTAKDSSGQPSKKTLQVVQLVLTVLGIALSVYLLVQHTRLKSGIQEGQSFCSFGKYADCDAVNASDFAEVGGIPIASFGAVFFFLLFMGAVLSWPKGPSFERWQRYIAWLCVVGLVIDLFLFGVQTFELHTYCLLCLTSYLVTIGVFIIAGFMLNRGAGFKKLYLAALLRPLASNAKISSGASAVLIISMVAFGWAIAMLPANIRLKSESYKVVNDAVEQFFVKWRDLPIKKIPVKPGDGTFGNSASKVQIVEFSDFQCPFCKRTAFTMHTLLNSLGNRVFFVFKNYPLDNACNPKVTYQMHLYACKLAKLAYCSAQKGKFWNFHDAVFLNWDTEKELVKPPEKGNDPLSNAVTKGPLSSVFTEGEYKKCLSNPAAEASIGQDLNLGTSFGITGTPTIFINGKQVTIPMSVENLKRLIEIEETL